MISRRRLRTDFFTNYLFVYIGNLEDNTIPDDAKITSDALTLEMFGLKEGINPYPEKDLSDFLPVINIRPLNNLPILLLRILKMDFIIRLIQKLTLRMSMP